MELSGADLLAALENGVSRVEDRAGRFPQVAGLRLAYDPGAPAGSRVVEVEWAERPSTRRSSTPSPRTTTWRAAVTGYASLGNGRLLIDAAGATLMATMVMDYIESLGTVSPAVDGRIRVP